MYGKSMGCFFFLDFLVSYYSSFWLLLTTLDVKSAFVYPFHVLTFFPLPSFFLSTFLFPIVGPLSLLDARLCMVCFMFCRYQRFNNIVVQHPATWTSPQQAVDSRLYQRSSVLRLSNVGFRDAGWYWCHVSNVFGSDWSSPSNVTVVGRKVVIFKNYYGNRTIIWCYL